MDSETAKERIADAIDALIPDCANRSSWLRGEALAMNMPYATLRKYHGSSNPRTSDHECKAGAYLSMCKQWSGFHERVIDATDTPPPDIAKATAHIKAALEEMGVRDNVTDIAFDYARRTDMK